MQDKNFRFFLKNIKQLEKAHKNKFVIIHNKEPKNYFNDFNSAYDYAEKNYEDGTYIVQQCSRKATFVNSRRFVGAVDE